MLAVHKDIKNCRPVTQNQTFISKSWVLLTQNACFLIINLAFVNPNIAFNSNFQFHYNLTTSHLMLRHNAKKVPLRNHAAQSESLRQLSIATDATYNEQLSIANVIYIFFFLSDDKNEKLSRLEKST